MNRGTVLAGLLVAAYLGFEGYAIKQASDRTEPSYIHNLLVEAGAAAKLCDFGDENLQGKFERTLARVKNQYSDDLLETLTPEQVEKQIEEESVSAISRVQSIAQPPDCSSQVMKDYFQRYRIYARRSK